MSESYIPAALRRDVRERALHCCEYCLLSEDDAYFPHEADHIISVKHRGRSLLANLAWSCFDCNRFKGSDIASLDTITGELVPLFNPRVAHWDDHFQLDSGTIISSTPIGRATISLLKFNLPQRVDIRIALIQSGRYPRRPH